MCLWSTDWLIDKLYVQPLLPPDARTVLLPESNNCRAYTPAIHRPTDRADTHTIYHRPTDRADMYTIYYQPTNYADMPTIPITVVLICLQPKHN